MQEVRLRRDGNRWVYDVKDVYVRVDAGRRYLCDNPACGNHIAVQHRTYTSDGMTDWCSAVGPLTPEQRLEFDPGREENYCRACWSAVKIGKGKAANDYQSESADVPRGSIGWFRDMLR